MLLFSKSDPTKDLSHSVHVWSRVSAQTHPKHHNFVQSVTHCLTFLTFSKYRQTRPDLPNTSVARIPIVTVGLHDLWRIMIRWHALLIQTANWKVLHVTPDADELSDWEFLLPLGPFGDYTYKTRHWSRSIIHGHYAKQWRRVLGDIWLKLTTEACIILLGIYFKVRKQRR